VIVHWLSILANVVHINFECCLTSEYTLVTEISNFKQIEMMSYKFQPHINQTTNYCQMTR